MRVYTHVFSYNPDNHRALGCVPIQKVESNHASQRKMYLTFFDKTIHRLYHSTDLSQYRIYQIPFGHQVIGLSSTTPKTIKPHSLSPRKVKPLEHHIQFLDQFVGFSLFHSPFQCSLVVCYVPILSGQPRFRDFDLIRGRFFIQPLIGMSGALMYFSLYFLRALSRLMCETGIFAKTGNQGQRIDFNVPEIIIIDRLS